MQISNAISIPLSITLVKKFVHLSDEKLIALSTGEPVTVRIEDFNHDNLASGGKAGITIAMKNLLATTYNMNPTNTNAGGWSSSAMRARMATFLSQLPADLQAVIKPVLKKGTTGSMSASIQTTTDSLWLYSAVEVGLRTTEEGYKDEGETYPLFVSNASRIKYLSNGAGSAGSYGLRSPSMIASSRFSFVGDSGAWAHASASDNFAVCLGFCVA